MAKGLTCLLALGLAAAASAVSRRQADTMHHLVVGCPAQIVTVDFDGKQFSLVGKTVSEGTSPSWLLPSGTDELYAVNENANNTGLYKLVDGASEYELALAVEGASGVVHLEFNNDKTRIVGASYGLGVIDVYDVSSQGRIALKTQIEIAGALGPGQTTHRPHQATLDPTGRFFAVPNLGGDAVLVLDSKDDAYEVTGAVQVDAGCGPRHGGFITVSGGEAGSGKATHYLLACEISNELHLFSLHYAGDTMEFALLQRHSTYGEAFPPANASAARASELVIASNQRDVYVSNRLSGNETDSIARFSVTQRNGTSDIQLEFGQSVSSGGLLPRHMSLSGDESFLFVANQGGESGLVAFSRCAYTGAISPLPVAKVPLQDLVAEHLLEQGGMGPMVVREV